MAQRLDVFLPPEAHQTPQHTATQPSSIRWWFLTLALGGMLKIYQCMPVSLDIGSPVVASESIPNKTPSTNKEDTPPAAENQEKTTPSTPDNTNPMLITLNDMQVLQQLKKRRAEIESNSKEQEDRLREMEILNETLKKNIAELNAIKTSLDAEAKAIQKEPQEALQKMAKLYEGMKPAQAAKILEDMETIVAAKIIALIKKQVASGIMASLSDKKARAITLQTLQMKQTKPQ